MSAIFISSDRPWISVAYLLYEVHTFGRLHAVRVVNDVRDVVFGAQRGQLLNPTNKPTTRDDFNVACTNQLLGHPDEVGNERYLSGTRGAKQDVVE